MKTEVINLKVEPRVKKAAQRKAKQLGLNLSSLINAYLKHIIKAEEIRFSLKEKPSEYLRKAVKEAKEDIKAGRVISFVTPGEELRYLDSMIANEKRSQRAKRS